MAARMDCLAVEEPLEIRMVWHEDDVRHDEALTITMRTPGEDLELAAGLLFSEGVVRTQEQLLSLRIGEEPNTVLAELAAGQQLDARRFQRYFYGNSSCGVCGKMAIESLRLLHEPQLRSGWPSVPVMLPGQLPQRLLAQQLLFAQTGGVHAAGLFSPDGTLLLLREDIGRHNAVDKVLGACLLQGNPHPADCVLVTSGRAGYEIVQKALSADIAVLVAVGAPSSLAVEMAKQYGMTLIGFGRDSGFNLYCDDGRLVSG